MRPERAATTSTSAATPKPSPTQRGALPGALDSRRDEVKGVAYDTPVLGYRVNTCNTLRLWKSEAGESFDLEDFNVGDYYGAVQEKVISETLTKVLYPNDEPEIGKRLRLAQQYFFVSCSLQDMLRLLDMKGEPIERLPDLFAVQLNDTHPSIAVAELMRLLVDERGFAWEQAWDITRRTFAYTNHTLLPEALETWAVPLFATAAAAPSGDHLRDQPPLPGRGTAALSGRRGALARGMSLIDEAGETRVRMAQPRHRRQPRGQRRGRAASELLQQTCCGISPSSGRRSSAM